MENDHSQPIEVAISDSRWHGAVTDLASRCRSFASAAVEQAQATTVRAAELSIVLADDRFVQGLNRRYRGVDCSTNVLSFPMDEKAGERSSDLTLLGDIVLAYETVTREAELSQRSVEAHIAHLLVHGVLHLFGRDHEHTAEAEQMEAEEVAILASLGFADPYAAKELT